ncbi:hypothetical protein BDV12DRAFT_209262 [Aspergillus spectabilis]
MTSGSHHHRIKGLHDRYGPVVRVAPDELSFIDGKAWHDIYSKGPGNKGLLRSEATSGTQPVHNVFDTHGEEHTRVHRKLMNSLSDNALARQEPILQQYITKMIDNLRRASTAREPINIAEWLNWFSFDVIGELALSESFDQLDRTESHLWVTMITSHIRSTAIYICLTFYPTLDWIVRQLASGALQRLLWEFVAPARDKINRRLTRPDSKELNDMIATCLPHANDGKEFVSTESLIGTFALLTIAGSETVATTLTAVINHLTRDSVAMEQLKKELRSVSDSRSLTLATLNQLPYLNAVIEEGLRLCHPVPASLIRKTPPEGTTIAGYFVSGNTFVGIPPYAAYRSEANFKSASEFLPERWLGERDQDHDKNSIFQPFIVGGHNCLGHNLARVELRLVLAHLVHQFDNEAVEKFRWEDQDSYLMWRRRPFMVRLKEAAEMQGTF